MNVAKMISGAIHVARNGETEQAKVMMLGILAITLDEMNKSLTRIEMQMSQQEKTLIDLMQTMAERVDGQPPSD